MIVKTKEILDFNDVTELLNMGINRKKIFELLKMLLVLKPNSEPYQKFLNLEYFIVDKFNVSGRIFFKILVTRKGLFFIHEQLSKLGYTTKP